MDIFNSVDNRISPAKPDRPQGKQETEQDHSQKADRKKSLTDEQIREKVALRFKDAKVDISKKARNHPGKVVKTESELPGPSDIQDNDPNNDMTQEKLRMMLDTEAFHFNDKERAALEEILFRS